MQPSHSFQPVRIPGSRLIVGLTIASLLALPLSTVPRLAEAATLNQWQVEATSNQLSFRTDSPVQPRAFLVETPNRIVIDIPGTSLNSGISRQDSVKRLGIQAIRLGQPTAQTARIVIELAPGYRFDLTKAPLRQINSTTWALSLNGLMAPDGKPVSPVAQSPAPPKPAPPKPAPSKPAPQTPAPQPSSNPVANPKFCRSRVNGALTPIATKIPGRLSVAVQFQGDSTNLFSVNPTSLLIPASNNKVFTTAAAFTKLGPQYKIRTPVLGDGPGPTVNTLRIVGQGDPSFSTADLQDLSQQLQRRGIKNVGTLIGDDTLFQGPTINPEWEAEDAGQAYAAPVNSLILNQNIIGITLFPQRQGQPLRVAWDDPLDQRYWSVENRSVTASRSGSEFINVVPVGARMVISGQLREGASADLQGVAIPNEGNYFVRKFDDILEGSMVMVDKTTIVKRTPAPAGLTELAAVESPALSELVYETNQQSNNLYSETLLKVLGAQAMPGATDTSKSGTAAVRSILAGLGVDVRQLQMMDGSGLAPSNRASGLVLVQTLQAMAKHPQADLYRRSLPIGGRSGTLSSRFRGTAAENRVFAKTGTISGVVSLGGYVTPRNAKPLVFGIIVNSSSSASAIRALVDEMVIHLAQLEGGC